MTNAHPAGSYPVTVKAFGPGGSTTASFTLNVTTPASCTGAVAFTSAADVASGSVNTVATGDFNNDGKQDLAYSEVSSSSVRVRLGNNDGTFGAVPTIVGVGSGGYVMTAGDFNGDGKLDLATANSLDNTITVALGNGDGTFAAGPTVSGLTGGQRGIATADMNGDGKLDLVTVGSAQLYVLTGNGAGGFSITTNFALGASGGMDVAVGDITGDGKLDVVAAHFSGSAVSVSIGDGLGGISSSSVFGSTAASRVTLGDVDNDGDLDLAIANGATFNGVSVRLNTAGSFGGGSNSLHAASGVAFADFNRDGTLDYVSTNFSPAQADVAVGAGNGNFTVVTTSNVGTSPDPNHVVVGDFNNDGKQDFITGRGDGVTGGIAVRLGACNPLVTVTGALASFGNVAVGGTSAEQTYTVSGSALTNDIIVTAPSTDFQVSKTSGSGFAPSITFTQSGGVVPNSPVFVRFTPQSGGAKAGNITNASSGATTQNVPVSGTGVLPILNVTTDPVVTEGNAGTILATFTVTLTPASSQTVTVHYSTQDDSATTADNDYVALADTLLTFLPTETTKNITVTVNGDTNYEPNEQFFFNINTPTNANISDNQGIGTITNDEILISGTKTVCPSGCDYDSLTNAGGLFRAMGLATVSGNVTALITGDLTNEGGIYHLNQWAEFGVGNYTLTIKPSGAPRAITGIPSALPQVIDLYGADRVTIDGSLSGGTDRSLTITSTSTASNSDVVLVESLGAGSGANNVTIKNCILRGAAIPATLSSNVYGIHSGASGPNFGNDNLTIQNNLILRASNGIFIQASAADTANNLVIQGNTIGDAADDTNTVSRAGISLEETDNASISGNTIQNVRSSDTRPFGIYVTGGCKNFSILRNTLTRIRYTGTNPESGEGMHIQTGITNANVTIANNSISDITGLGASTPSVGTIIGIALVNAQSGFKLYDNSINLGSGSFAGSGVGTKSMALYVNNTTDIDMRGNIFANNLDNTGAAGDKAYAVYVQAPANPFTTIDNNDYFASGPAGVLGFIGGADKTTITAWRTATGQDNNSIAADPQFTSATDLHIKRTSPGVLSPVENAGVTLAGITTDYEGDTRDASTPEIGADEVTSMQFSSATYNVAENVVGGLVTITVTRTAGSVNAATIHYATGDSAAIGGATCGGSTDYVNASGTLNFAAGETSKTFDVSICPDSTYEGDEEFNVTLDSPGGGSILGSPDAAVVNITEDDAVPSFTIDDVSHNEGNAGTTSYTFTVTKTGATALNSEVDFITQIGTATTADNDYVFQSGTLLFTPGDTTKPITVLVNGDTTVEPNEAFTVHLSNPQDATIGDADGTGTITNDDACAAFATVYVDDSWVGTTPGTDPDAGGPATSFGCDSFATIQEGVNAVTAGGTVNVAAGNYVENVTIPKALTLTGAGAASVFVYPAVSNPNCGGGGGGSICAGGSNIMLVQASNVTISGMTLDGDNTSLAGGVSVNGANVDARNGIITNHLLATYNNLEVHHTTVKNIYLRGIYASSSGTFNFHDNTVQNVQAEAASIGMFNFGGAGAFTNNTVSLCNDAISSNHSRGTSYTGNTVTTSASGIHTDNAGDGGGTADTISGNTVTNSAMFGYGIWVYLPYKTVNVQNNTTTNVVVGFASFGMAPGISAKPAQEGEQAKSTRPVPAVFDVSEPATAARLQSVHGPLAPPAPPYAAIFTGNTADGQHNPSSTGVYFTTSQIAFGSSNTKVKFFSNTVIHNADGFYLEAETGFTLETAASFNRIIDNDSTAVTVASGGSFTGTLNGSMENNWWGCNAGPNNAGCGNIVGAGVDFDPWIVLGISASPSTISPGGTSTITADMTHNSANAVPSVTDFVPQVAVTFGATNGTVLPTSGTIVNGQATTTFTSNSTSSGSASATVDNQTVNTPINVSAANTYTWTATVNSDWQVPLNWAPTRVLPQATDILLVDGAATPGPTITNVPTQTVAAFRLLNGALATLNGATLGQPHTLTINGASGSDLSVPAGCFLSLDGSNGLSIKLSGSGTTGTIGGTAAAQNGFHRLFGDANATITFQNGSFGTAGPGLTTNMFGTGALGDGQTGSVIFASGSIYSHNAGDSPFGTVGNGPVVTFQTGSLARWFSNSGFQASGRTYANLQISAGLLNAYNVSDSGTGNFQFDNLDIKSTSSANSSLTYTGSGTASITIRGNVTSTGAGDGGTLPDLILTPGSGGTHINKNGGGTLILNATGNARAVDLEGGATVENGTTLALSRVALLGLSNPHLKFLTVDTTADITGGPTGYVVGSLARVAVPSGSSSFPVGTAGEYSPVDLANASGGGSLTVAARTPQQPVLTAGTSLHRYWSLTQETGSVTTDLTFHYLDGDVNGNENNYELIVVKSGNATSFPNSCPNTCVDPSANTIHRSGVSTFSDWTAAEPAAPTAVKLVDFNAVQNGNEVMLSWQTGYETRNLGYNVYREQGGRRTAITPSLVAGSALLAGSNTKLSSGLNYTWYDDLRDVRSQKSPVNYWLEDVDINGTRTLHGPIAVSDCASVRADCKQLGGRRSSRLLNQVSGKGATAGVQFRAWPVVPAALKPELGGEHTKTPKSADADADDLARQQTLIEARPGVKIAVSREGWYRVTQPELVTAGLDPDADTTRLQLYVNGRAVPVKLSATGGHLSSSDYLEFYGQGLQSTTDKAQTYYLTLADGVGTRIRSPFADPLSPPNGPPSFAYTIERKERMIYFSGLLNGAAENFFGQIVTAGQTVATIPVSRLDSETTAQLAVTLQGVTSQSHAVRVSLNGNDLGSVLFANTDHATETFNISGVDLLEGDNTIGLTATDGGDVSLVDVIRLTYGHKYLADNNHLEVLVHDGETKQFGGFDNANIRVIDVTSPSQVKELTPAANVTSLEDGTFAIDVRVPGATELKQHKVLVFTEATVNTVDSVRPNNASSWWSETAGADYLIITTDDLKASVAPLSQLRSNQGLAVRVIDVEDIYDEFSFGEHSPQAVRDFLAKAVVDWTTKPRYVVFAGDASYDPKNYLGLELGDLVPTKLIDTSLSETASDDWLADFNNDGIADFAIGRLPVRTATEMNALVVKIVNYENTAPDPTRGALLVSDSGFEAPSTAVQSLLPAGMTVATINRSSADDATIHNQIVAGINQGPRITNYIGHGSNGVWTGASLLSNNDAPNLTNTNRLSVFTMMTCYNGYFQDAFNDSLSEALLKAPGGAVAVWASTTLTQPAGQNAIDQEFYRMLFGVQPATLGDAARGAKLVTGDADVRRTWTLFGDPAMRLR
ncbi:MAG TPA: C25 family cysteine peptidase [Pyrinomonadaceae bacterium]|nr:C25 family cysteine peptidase [Pyrinomonadaceae bacterium]